MVSEPLHSLRVIFVCVVRWAHTRKYLILVGAYDF
jgi:hypothetical protein